MKKNVLFILIAIFVSSCNSNDDNLQMLNVTSSLIAKGNLYGNGAEEIIEQNLEITDQKTWSDLITKMNSVNNTSDSFSEIDIDFSQYKIIAIFDEIRTNGGHGLELNIRSNAENMIVRKIETVSEGNTTTVIAQPFLIVKISNTTLPIIFE